MHRLVYIVLLSTCAPAFAQRLNFYKEDITLRLDCNHLSVEGYYWFANSSKVTISSEIFYPFPFDAGGLIDSIGVLNLTAGEETRFKKEEQFGISFFVAVESSDSVLLQINYRQQLNSDSAVYILKSTKNWGKPLDVAEFKLITPDSLTIKQTTYPPDELFEMAHRKIYVWRRRHFWPEHNMVFYW